MTKAATVLKNCLRSFGGRCVLCLHALVPKDDRIVLVTRPDGDDQGAPLCLALEKLHWKGENPLAGATGSGAVRRVATAACSWAT